MADAADIRKLLDAAMREWVARGDAAALAFSEAVNAKPRNKAVLDAAWSAYHASHDDDCRAHRESLNCCLDHEHEKYEQMLDFLVAKMAESL